MTKREQSIRSAILCELAAAAPDNYTITTRALHGGVRLAVSPEPSESEITDGTRALEEEGFIHSAVHPLKGRRWSLTPLGRAACA